MESLSEWEWEFIKAAVDAKTVRKRFREELEYLHSVGNILNVLKDDLVLAHVLAYSWKDTYRLAQVNKRFYNVTKSRAYWAALAKHALKDKVPSFVLKDLDFFHLLPAEKPSRTYFQGLLKKPATNRYGADCIELYRPFDSKRDAIVEVHWKVGENAYYQISHYLIEKSDGLRALDVEQRTEFFGFNPKKKVVWHDMKTSAGRVVSVYDYCEVYDSERNQIWYGQPGKREGPPDFFLTTEECLPNPWSWGVWK